MITMKVYQYEQDFERMKNLIRENYLNNEIKLSPSPMDLDYWRYIYDDNPDSVNSAVLWEEEDGHLLAFAWMNEEVVDYVTHYNHKYLLNDIIAWSEITRLQNQSDTNVLYIFDFDQESKLVAIKNGYQKSTIFNYYGRRNLLDKLPEVSLPTGYIIKSLETNDEIKIRAKLNELAGNKVTLKKYQYFQKHALSYCKDLDLVVVYNNEVVGFCTTWFDEVTKTGMFEPYAICPHHQGKGLGKALLYKAMNKLINLGCKEVFVIHAGLEEGEVDSALRLNAAVGFQNVSSNYLWYKKFSKSS